MEPGPQFTGPRLFHGSREALPADATHILPASKTGVPARASAGFTHDDGTPHTDSAFATPSEHIAMAYATQQESQSNHHVLADSPRNTDPHPRHRGVLYELSVPKDAKWDGGPEVASKTGFPITAVHHSASGVTGTFPEVNWNAYKARRKSNGIPDTVSSDDANHWDSSRDNPKPVWTPPAEHAEHPGQLNLFSGHTVAEHDKYENTMGALIHMNPEQFPESAAMHRDPTTSVIRSRKHFSRMDTELGTAK